MTLAAYARRRPDRVALAALTLVNVVLIFWLPVLGGHDLPQHLSYARILADYDDPGLVLRDTFTLPEGYQAYFTTYYLLAALTRLAGVMNACRIVYAAYAAALPWSIAALVDAASGPSPARPVAWTVLLGPLAIWNPVSCMGFLPFMLALPLFVFAAAVVVRALHDPTRSAAVVLVVLSAMLVSTHIVAALLFVALAAFLTLARPGKTGLALFGLVVASTGAAMVAWQWAGPGHVAALPAGTIRDAVTTYGVVPGLARAFGARWASPSEKLGLLEATVLGPFPSSGKSFVATCLVGTACFMGGASNGRSSPRRTLRWALVGFAALCGALPASLAAPDAICLIDFRAMVVLLLLLIAALEPGRFEPLRARWALGACVSLVTVLWVRQLTGVSREGEDVVKLVQRLGPRDILLALAFHDRSEFLDEANSITHYLPVYHTALNGGVTSLFWGRFSHHLPVGYRSGKEPPHPPDWKPWAFSRRDLDAATAVLVEWPDTDDGADAVLGADPLRGELGHGFRPVECRGRWCLYANEGSQAALGEQGL
jgi:uncharacterized membrane protein YhaH (DUF805 family)